MKGNDIDPHEIWGDLSLSANAAKRQMLEKDAALSVGEFAKKHGPTIRQHYAAEGYAMDPETAYKIAEQVWGFLQSQVNAIVH